MISRKGFISIKLIALVMSGTLTLSAFGCSKKEAKKKSKISEPTSITEAEDTTDGTTPTATETEISSETTEETTQASAPTSDSRSLLTESPRTKSSFTEYIPYVLPPITKEMMTPNQIDIFYRFCEAVLANEESFECDNYSDLETVFYLVVRTCCPYAYQVATIQDSWEVSGNVVKIQYRGDLEWRKSKYDGFKNAVEDLLQNVLKEEYSDFENALALFEYFTDNYVYDFEHNGQDPENIGAYIPLIRKTGVCQNFAAAYTFVLLQTGCDVDNMEGAMSETEATSHEWNIIRLDGQCYMIDTTWGLGRNDLKYFLMTKEDRQEDGQYFIGDMDVGLLLKDYGDDRYLCNDTKYSELHQALEYTWNPEDNTISLRQFDVNGELKEYTTFKYE